jgi:cytochrome P450
MSASSFEMLLDQVRLAVHLFAAVAFIIFIVRTAIRHVIHQDPLLPLPTNPPALPRPWPILGHLPALGRVPHRSLTALSRRHGPVYSMQLGTRRAVVVNGHAAVRAAFSGSSTGGSLDDRPDFEAYRHYAAGRSISFQGYGPRLRLHRRLATRAVARLMVSGRAEEVVRREAEGLVEGWTGSGVREGFDPAEDLTRAVGGAIYSLCYGADARLADDREYCEVLLERNPGTELFAIGNQVNSCGVWH